uniref:Uncharacterized protein n=1 Tax=Anguilla anguilla TaxID=7936 RepID=A0A0E9PKV2_ANGAN
MLAKALSNRMCELVEMLKWKIMEALSQQGTLAVHHGNI